MRVHLGGDHAAYALQRALVDHLTAAGHEVIDHGPLAYDAMDDYPVFVLRAAQAVAADPGSAGIVLGGSGNGEVMAANKVRLVFGAFYQSGQSCISVQRVLVHESIADAFLATDFSGDERHARRLAMVSRFEADGSLPEG